MDDNLSQKMIFIKFIIKLSRLLKVKNSFQKTIICLILYLFTLILQKIKRELRKKKHIKEIKKRKELIYHKNQSACKGLLVYKKIFIVLRQSNDGGVKWTN